jgi:hypothetical protein
MKAAMLSAQTKRPASHKWALFVFFLAAATNIMLNAHGRFDVLGVVVTLAALGALFASFFFARARYTYTLGILTLSLVFLRSIQSLWFDIKACRDGLFHLPQTAQFLLIAFVCAVAFLLFLLLRAYTLGAMSRRYYGLPAISLIRKV